MTACCVRVLGVLLCMAGCGGEEATEFDPEWGQSQGEVVAQVGEQVLTSADVERELLEGGTVHEALNRLVDQALLAEEAGRRGFGSSAAQADEEQRAMVRGLLRQAVESPVQAENAPEEALRELYLAAGERFQRPESRFVVHYLAEVEQDAPAEERAEARALARRALSMVEEIGVESAFESLAESVEEGVSRVEELADVRVGGPYVPEFVTPLYEVSEPSVVPQLVETSFGFHVIWFREATPPLLVPFEDARAELAEEWVIQERHRRLDTLVEELAEDAFGGPLAAQFTPEVMAQLAALPLRFDDP